MKRGSAPLLLALLLCIVACSKKPEQHSTRHGAPEPDQAPAEVFQASGIDRPARPGLPSCVREPVRCNKAYLSFAEREHAHARPVKNCENLYAELISQWQAQLVPPPSSASRTEGTPGLRKELLESLNLGFLLREGARGLQAPNPEVLVLREEGQGSFRQFDLVLRDKAVGDIPLLLALPSGEGPFPVVLALPGHGEVPRDVLKSLPPEQITARGMALVVVGMRAYDSLVAEHDATMTLLCQGFSLMGLRVYEALVAMEYIHTNSKLKGDAVGLVGHSGGSATLNLVVWLSEAPRALITDLRADYFNLRVYMDRYYVLDETHPRLRELAPQINDVAALPLPVLEVPYGAPEGHGPLLDFLVERLQETP